jgi:hypothetical protein
MREREVEAYLVRLVKTNGGDTRKVRWIGRVGAPDRLVLFPGYHFLIEMKRPKGGILEAHQVREHERLRRAGFTVHTAYTKEEVDNINDLYPWKRARESN